VGNIGGTLSLCLGISILSIIEIFELFLTLVEICRKVKQEKCNKNQNGNEKA
jgi:hypothetical protein